MEDVSVEEMIEAIELSIDSKTGRARNLFSPWERDFFESVSKLVEQRRAAQSDRELSDNQRRVLEIMWNRIGREAAKALAAETK